MAAQNYQSGKEVQQLPSKDEINALVNKAVDKINEFDKALKAVKPLLDKNDPNTYAQYSDAIETARATTGAIKKNGPSAYTLVALISILDDLKLDSAVSGPAIAFESLKQENKAQTIQAVDISRFLEAGTGCYDISELLLHTTLRYVNVEESLLLKLLGTAKK